MRFDAFVGRSYVSQSSSTDNEETICLTLERVESGEGKSEFVLIKSPGLSTKRDLGVMVPVRGMMELDNVLYAVAGTTIYLLNSVFTTLTSYGPIAADGRPAMLVSDPAGSQVVVLSAGIPYLIQSSTLSIITWLTTIPALIKAVGFLNSFFLFLPDAGNGFYFSEPGDANTGTAANFRTAEASANQYISMLVDHEEVWLFGTKISQVFYLSGNPAEPFAANLSAIIPQGTAAASSPIALNNTIYWLGSSEHGETSAWSVSGYTPVRVSNHAVENRWRRMFRLDDAISWAVSWNGHLCWRIYFQDADETWQYDAMTQDWTKQMEFSGGAYHAHRGYCAVAAFGLMLVGDRGNGKIMALSPDYLDDAGTRIRCLRRAPTISNDGLMTRYSGFELDMARGVGIPADSTAPEFNPEVLMRYSNNNGVNWSNELARQLGQDGNDRGNNVRWNRTGIGRKRVFEVSISASVKVIINNAYLPDDTEVLAG